MMRLRTAFGRFWDRRVAWHGERVILHRFDCAMHGAVNIRTRWGALCFALPWAGGEQCPRHDLPGYLYLSPNSTPWAATFVLGKRFSRDDRRKARVRRVLWGHGYDCWRLDPQVLDLALDATEFRDEAMARRLERMLNERNEWLLGDE